MDWIIEYNNFAKTERFWCEKKMLCFSKDINFVTFQHLYYNLFLKKYLFSNETAAIIAQWPMEK